MHLKSSIGEKLLFLKNLPAFIRYSNRIWKYLLPEKTTKSIQTKNMNATPVFKTPNCRQ